MTIKDCLNRAANENPDAVALRYKQDGAWATTSFRQLRERAWHVSEMLVEIGVTGGDRVAIYRENSPEWFEIYHGIVGIGAIAVPVDAKLREQEVAHIFHDCGVSVVFASCRFAEALAGMSGRLHGLRSIVMLDCEGRNEHLCEKIEQHIYKALWRDVSGKATGNGRVFDRMSPTASSPASVIYTSGTTGRQKGAVLTHRNFMSNVASIAKAIKILQTD
ncbi:MAG: AMP-binding protein, partial [Verrucomicrobiota bacterium]|nr:AMP-binding protein [Verrucomicrobiota bacterium]